MILVPVQFVFFEKYDYYALCVSFSIMVLLSDAVKIVTFLSPVICRMSKT